MEHIIILPGIIQYSDSLQFSSGIAFFSLVIFTTNFQAIQCAIQCLLCTFCIMVCYTTPDILLDYLVLL